KSVAALALSGLLLFMPSSAVKKPKPADVPKDPSKVLIVPGGLTSGLELPPTGSSTPPETTDQPPVQPPDQQPDPTADHMVTLGGEYNPDTHTGAVWFAVEDYAAGLGHPKLTILQVHRLTQ